MTLPQSFNFHTHTSRCGHADGSDEQYIKAAIEAGYTTIGMSDHAPYRDVIQPKDRMNFEDKQKYLESFRALKKGFSSQIDVKIGFEVEYFNDRLDELQQLREDSDYLLLGQHIRDFTGYDYGCFNNDDDVKEYTEAIVTAMQRGLVDIIAHPDYFMLGRRTWNQTCVDAAIAISEVARKTNTPLEINLCGVRYGKFDYNIGPAYSYPFREFWRIVSQYQSPVIYGVDAHYPFVLLETKRYDVVDEILKGIPLNRQNEINFLKKK